MRSSLPEARDYLLTHFTAFRAALFFCCAGYSGILYGWLRPEPRAFRSGLLAVLVQLWVGLWGDLACVHAGFWSYREMPFNLSGIPIDLHVDWAILWGLALVWLSDRWPGRRTGPLLDVTYLGVWTLVTLLFDAAMAHWLLFLEAFSSVWWVGDLAFLLLVQGFTLWFYRSVEGHPRGLSLLPPLPPYLRSLVYISFFVPFFFIWIPDRIFDAARGFGFEPRIWHVPGIPLVLAALAVALGGWAIWEFARRGEGTPVPWDPARRLVETGPYAFVANPMQISGVLLSVTVLLRTFSWLTAVYLVDIVVVVGAVFDILEPQTLRERFGAPYVRYRSFVRLWWPSARPYPPPEDARPVLLFDDTCWLCRAVVVAFERADTSKIVRTSPLRGELARSLLSGMPGADSLVLVEPPLAPSGLPLISLRSQAVLRALGRGPLAIAWLSAWEGIPGVCAVGDVLYRTVARHRPRSDSDAAS